MSIAPEVTNVRRRNNLREVGNPAGRPLVLAHGFGCSQEAWRHVVPRLSDDYRVILFDHVGSGASDIAAYDRGKYDSLHGYADDVLEIMSELNLHDAVFVGHSVSSMIGALAANRDPSRFGALVMLGPSPRYINDGDYIGGFDQADIDALLDSLDANYRGWSAAIAPVIMGNPAIPELGAELVESFCATDPTVAKHFAHVTFLSDNRGDLAHVSVPTLILQAMDDVIAPEVVGQYVHQQIAGSSYVLMDAHGHCANMSSPAEVAAQIRAFLA